MGTHALVWRAIYGGKSAGKDFRNHLRSCMRHLYFESHPSDPDVWMRPAKNFNGTYYYEFILLYTNDALVISENSEQVLHKDLGRYFELKEKSIGPPKIYLGGSARQAKLENGVRAWDLDSYKYINLDVNNVEAYVSNK